MASFQDFSGPPIVMSVAGDVYIDGCRIMVIMWEGATTTGDTALIVDRITNQILWKGRTSDTQTYQGANFSAFGIPCPHGFKLQQISNGSVYVYIAQA